MTVRPMRGTGLTVLLTLACACGGGGGGQQAAGASGPTGPSGSSGPSGPGGLTGPTGPSGASGPTSNGSVLLQRLDPDSECDGLVPDRAPAPVEVHLTPPSGATCGGGIADGTGHVALPARSGGGATWQVFGPDGAAASSFSAWPVVPEPSGWQGLRADAGAPGTPVALVAFGPDGASLGATPVNSAPSQVGSDLWSLAQDPAGGAFALVGETDLFHNHFTRLEAQRFDAAGAPRWPAPVQLPGNGDHTFEFLGAGVSTRGEALALSQHSGSVDVLWLDAGGATVASQVEAERADGVLGVTSYHTFTAELVPLLDGGLAVRADGTFQRAYPRLATLTAPLPAWLASRATWTFRFTRGNRGYALLPPAGEALPACAPAIELVAPSGRLCGRVTLPGTGSACASGAVDQGWDGTVVQQRARDGCDYRFWPGLLAR